MAGPAAASGPLVFAFHSAYDLYVPNAYVPCAAWPPTSSSSARWTAAGCSPAGTTGWRAGGLARGLGMDAYWGPADGPLWGDAVLTALPVTRQERHPLTPSGPTGAQALEVTVDWSGTEVTVVSTHVQPADHGFGEQTSRRRLRDVAEIARGARERGGPAVVAGDLNIEPDDPANPDVPHSDHRPVAVTPTPAD